MICPRCDGGGWICDHCQEPAEYLMTDDDDPDMGICAKCVLDKGDSEND